MKHLDKHFIRYSFIMVCILILASWGYILSQDPDTLTDLVNPKNWTYLKKFIAGMLGQGEELPAFLDQVMWLEALKLSWDTFVMSILATGLATLGMFIFVIPTARNIMDGSLTLHQAWYYKLLYWFGRFLFIVSRSVPELMWAMILVFILKPGILPGALALAIHNFGILGKLCAETIEDMDEKPIRHLAANGASQLQLLTYGILPAVMPKFINYILYRLENIVRATLIVGFVGASGLGMQFKLAMSFFRYSEITLYLLCYLLLVYVTDLITAAAKRFIKIN